MVAENWKFWVLLVRQITYELGVKSDERATRREFDLLQVVASRGSREQPKVGRTCGVGRGWTACRRSRLLGSSVDGLSEIIVHGGLPHTAVAPSFVSMYACTLASRALCFFGAGSAIETATRREFVDANKN